MRRISITSPCTADRYVTNKERERIVEFSDPETGLGGLISFRRTEEGTLIIEPYRCDARILIHLPGKAPAEISPAEAA